MEKDTSQTLSFIDFEKNLLQRLRSPELKPITYSKCIRKLGAKNLITIFLFHSGGLRTFLSNFILVYNLRAGFSLFVRMLLVIRKDPKALFSLKALLSESGALGGFKVTEHAMRAGLFIGLFTSLYKSILFFLAKINFYRHIYGIRDDRDTVKENELNVSEESISRSKSKVMMKPWHSAFAGFIAGASLLSMEKSWHRDLALYTATRLCQCIYNYNRDNGYFHFWGSKWNHGDSLLFAIVSAQVMYAYILRPETLSKSYYTFIRDTGPVQEPGLQAVRASVRGKTVDVQSLLEYVIEKSKGNKEIMKKVIPFLFSTTTSQLTDAKVNLSNASDIVRKLEARKEIRLIPVQAFHPYTKSTLLYTIDCFRNVIRRIFPLYLGLTLVPAIGLRFKSFIRKPLSVIIKSILGALRSSVFLSMFCGGYLVVIVIQRLIVESLFRSKLGGRTSVNDISSLLIKDNKLLYWLAGFICSWSVLIEKKNRRSDLAMYVFPKALDSAYRILLERKYLIPVPYGELIIFCSSMSGLMCFYENHYEQLPPFIGRLMRRFLCNDLVLKQNKLLEDLNSVGVSTDASETGSEIE